MDIDKYINYKGGRYEPGTNIEKQHIEDAVLMSKVLNVALESGLSVSRIESVLIETARKLKFACLDGKAEGLKNYPFEYCGTEIKIAGERDERSPAED